MVGILLLYRLAKHQHFSTRLVWTTVFLVDLSYVTGVLVVTLCYGLVDMYYRATPACSQSTEADTRILEIRFMCKQVVICLCTLQASAAVLLTGAVTCGALNPPRVQLEHATSEPDTQQQSVPTGVPIAAAADISVNPFNGQDTLDVYRAGFLSGFEAMQSL